MITVRQFVPIINDNYLFVSINNQKAVLVRKWQFINVLSRNYRKNIIDKLYLEGNHICIRISNITKEINSYTITLEDILPIIDESISLDLININSKNFLNTNIKRIRLENKTIILTV